MPIASLVNDLIYMQDNILQKSSDFLKTLTDISSRFPVAWERVSMLMDNTNFFELAALVGYAPHSGSTNQANVLTGLGYVSQRLCFFIAHEPTKLAGAMTPSSIEKVLRAQEIAAQQALPIIYLVQSAGLDLRQQAGGFVAVGKIFANMARLSKQGVPQVSICYGTATAGGAYMVGMADFTILLANQSQVFLAGPNLVSYAIGERNTPEQLGGSLLHQHSGLADVVVNVVDEIQPVLQNWLVCEKQWPVFQSYQNSALQPYTLDSIASLKTISSDYRRMFAMPELVHMLVDESYHVYKPSSHTKMLCYFASIKGCPVGVIANLAPIDTQSAYKVVQFIERCERAGTPLLFMMHTTGFQVGRDAERSGIINAGSRLIQAVTNTELPKITLQIGGAFGAGYYAMCGRPFSADVVFSWPTAKLAVMGPEAGAQLLTSLKVQSSLKRGKPLSSQGKKSFYDTVHADITQKMDVAYTSAQLWDDGIIDPLETRDKLAFWLDIFAQRNKNLQKGKDYGLPRIH